MTAAMTIIASKAIAFGFVAACAVAGAIVAGSPRAALVNNSMEQIYGANRQSQAVQCGENAVAPQGPDVTPALTGEPCRP